MRPVDISEIKNIAEYELIRPGWRPLVMALKDRRRVPVGDHLTFLFENRETVRYLIQEMMRIERIVRPEDIAHEVETYNDLIPARAGLSASLLIEYTTPEERAVRLRELIGLENHVWLDVGGGGRTRACFDTRQISTDRLSAVQYVKFQLTPEQAAKFSGGAKIVVDHPRYQAEQALAGYQLKELAEDLK